MAANIIIRDSVLEDIESLSLTMRETDKAEVWAQNHSTPKEALQNAYKNSEQCYTVLFDGKVCAMFGIVNYSLATSKAIIWALTGGEIEKFPVKFVKLSKEYITKFLVEYDTLFNYVDARYVTALKWLKICGAKINPAENMGVENIPFHRVEFGGLKHGPIL